MAAYLIYGWSFDQGLVDYLNKAETARLDPLVVRLADGYRQNGGWTWLTSDRGTLARTGARGAGRGPAGPPRRRAS